MYVTVSVCVTVCVSFHAHPFLSVCGQLQSRASWLGLQASVRLPSEACGFPELRTPQCIGHESLELMTSVGICPEVPEKWLL